MKHSRLRTEQEVCNHSSNKNAKNRTEREDRSSTQNGTNGMEQNGMEQNENGTIKKKQEWKDWAEGPHSRMEQNDFKKSGTCPALVIRLQNATYVILLKMLYLQN